MNKFKADIQIIAGNPFVFVPDSILNQLFKQSGKDKGPIPICGTINRKPYKQTLVKFVGAWRLYINMIMLQNSPRRIGEIVTITVQYDPIKRTIEPPQAFIDALDNHEEAKQVFNSLSPSKKLEIIRYLSKIKSEEILAKNISRAINFLQGKE